jgi:hypothetical protein
VLFLSRESEAASGQAVVLEALQALYNICFFHKRVHLEVAATSGIVPHLCRYCCGGCGRALFGAVLLIMLIMLTKFACMPAQLVRSSAYGEISCE